MTTYHEPEQRTWSIISVRGTAMEKSSVFEAHGVRSAFFRMAPGCQIPEHDHTGWVQVAVISGRMRVEQAGHAPRTIDPGGAYFVSPGEEHIETAETETVVLVTQAEDRFPQPPATGS